MTLVVASACAVHVAPDQDITACAWRRISGHTLMMPCKHTIRGAHGKRPECAQLHDRTKRQPYHGWMQASEKQVANGVREAHLAGEAVCGGLGGCDDGCVDGRRARVGGREATRRRRPQLLHRRTWLHIPAKPCKHTGHICIPSGHGRCVVFVVRRSVEQRPASSCSLLVSRHR